MVVVASNFEAPVEGVILATPNTKLVVNDQVLGTATLYITQDNVVWGGGFTPAGSAASTLSLRYPTISLHAIQREPSPALYMQLNYELEMPELQQPESADQETQTDNDGGNGHVDDDINDVDVDEELDPITQIRFVPDNEAALQEMFGALLSGQALHPDPADEDDFFMGEGDDDGDGDDNDMFEDAEESSAEQTASRLQQLNLNHANGHHGNGDVPENGPE